MKQRLRVDKSQLLLYVSHVTFHDLRCRGAVKSAIMMAMSIRYERDIIVRY